MMLLQMSDGGGNASCCVKRVIAVDGLRTGEGGVGWGGVGSADRLFQCGIRSSSQVGLALPI